MQLSTYYKLMDDEKMHKYLKENSNWYKYLNRSDANYDNFISAMKKKYRLGLTDRISDTIDNIDLITSIIASIK